MANQQPACEACVFFEAWVEHGSMFWDCHMPLLRNILPDLEANYNESECDGLVITDWLAKDCPYYTRGRNHGKKRP